MPTARQTGEIALSGRGQPSEAQVRGRPRHRPDQQTRHQTDRAHDKARQKCSADRNPEAEQLGDRRNVGVGNVQALEQRAWTLRSTSIPACGSRRSAVGPEWPSGPSRSHKLLDRRNDRGHVVGMVAARDEIGFGLGRENGG